MKENNVCSKAVGGDYAGADWPIRKADCEGGDVEIRPEDEGMPKERTLTEKRESSRCARLDGTGVAAGAAGDGYLAEGGSARTGADCLLRAFGGMQICCRVGTVRPGGVVGKVLLAPFQLSWPKDKFKFAMSAERILSQDLAEKKLEQH